MPGSECDHAWSLNLPMKPTPLRVLFVDSSDSEAERLLDGLRLADLIGGERRAALAAVDESTLISILDRAAAVAAITCSRPGADPPMLAELDAALS